MTLLECGCVAMTQEIVDPVCRVIPAEKRPETLPTKAEPTSVVERVFQHLTSPFGTPLALTIVYCGPQQEVMKIFLKNDAYKSLIVTSETTGKDVSVPVSNPL